jgi:hypothetical protein
MSDQEPSIQPRDGPLVSPAKLSAAVGTARVVTLREYFSSSGAILVGIAITVFGIFLPVVIVPYAFSDDYPILAMAVGFGPNPLFGDNILDAAAVNGRLFQGLFTDTFYSAAGTIDNLRFVRLFGVIGIVALALLLHWALVRSGIKRTFAALVAVLVCSLPSFQLYASWTGLFSSPYAALMGASASMLAVAAVDAPRNLVADQLIGATALLLSALLIYQPAAMFFWVFLAVAVIGVAHDSRRALRLVRTHFGIAAVALALGYVAVKIGAHVVGEVPNAQRNTLVHDLPGKARWFFKEPLYQSLNLFDLTPTRWLAALVATIATVGILLLLRHRRVRPLPYLGIAAVLIPLTYLPNLVVSENKAFYRTQVSLVSLIALYVCLGALGIWLTVRDSLQPRISEQALRATGRLALAMSVAFVGAGAFIASKNVTTLVVEPQMTELRMIRSQVATFPTGVPRVAFVQTGYDQGMTKLVRYDEFGLPSSWQPWIGASVLLILREEGRLPTQGPQPTIDILPWYTTTLPKNEPVVDVRGLQRLH